MSERPSKRVRGIATLRVAVSTSPIFIPPEIIGAIFSYLGELEEGVCAIVCKGWCNSSLSYGRKDGNLIAYFGALTSQIPVVQHLDKLNVLWINGQHNTLTGDSGPHWCY